MESLILPIMTLIAGAALGLFSNFLVNLHEHRQTVRVKLLELFFDARKEIVDIISVLADLRVQEDIPDDIIDKYGHDVATLYFKNYDFLPKKVLDALLLLNACLKSKSGKLYHIKGSRIIPLKKEGYSDFFDEAAVYSNIKIFGMMVLSGDNIVTKRHLAIKLHAQYVLFILNKYVSTNDLIRLTEELSKTKQP